MRNGGIIAMRNMKDKSKVLLSSYHVWKTKRVGGMHYIARYFCNKGINVDFLTFPFAWYHVFKRTERYNFVNFLKLIKGATYNVGQADLFNFIVTSLYTFSRFDRYLPPTLGIKGTILTFPKLNLSSYKLIILESNTSVLLIDLIKNKKVKLVYRISDPFVGNVSDKRLLEYERKVLEHANLVLFTSEHYRTLYSSLYPKFSNKFVVWKNGFDKDSFDNFNGSPYKTSKQVTNCVYVGTFPVDWDCILKCALALPKVNFYIIGPDLLPRNKMREVNKFKNIIYYNGMEPEKTIGYIKYADIGLLPYVYKPILEHFDISSKIYQYMYSELPIVSFDYGKLKNLSSFGVTLAKDSQEFIEGIRKNIGLRINYSKHISFDNISWDARLEELDRIFFSYGIIQQP